LSIRIRDCDYINEHDYLFICTVLLQSIGMFIGAALHPPWTVTMVPLGLLSMMLWGKLLRRHQ